MNAGHIEALAEVLWRAEFATHPSSDLHEWNDLAAWARATYERQAGAVFAAGFVSRDETATADTGLRERVANLHALTEGRDREGTSRWPECCRDTYSLAIEEAIAALDATAAPTTDTGARDE